MKRAWLVNLLLLVGVVGLALYAVYRPKQADQPKHKLTQLTASTVKRIRIEPRDGPRIELEKRGESWFLTAPVEARADRSQVDRLLDVLQATSQEKLPATDLARFDLDQPRLKVSFDDQTIAFGTSNSLTQEQYVLAGDGVYLLSPYFGSAVPTRPDRVLNHALFREGEKPLGFIFPQFRVIQHEGKWTVEPPPPDEKNQPSADELNRWVDEWRFASSLVTQPASGRKPSKQVQVQLADGKALSFGVLREGPELVLLREDEKLEYQFSADSGRKLMARPVAAPAPAEATSAVKAQ
jgi:hypothetical protein